MTLIEDEQPPASDPVGEFASALRRLREEAGTPPYARMKRSSGRAAATLHGAAKGETLPTWPVTADFVSACGGDLAAWRRRWEQAEKALRLLPTQSGSRKPSPYRGLRAYQESDAGLFFGRDRLIGQLAELTARSRFTVVLGASGSGKSSLLRAGLIPHWQSAKGGQGRPAAIRTLTLNATPLTTHRTHLEPAARDGDTFLVVDQFEELFTRCADTAERDGFITALLAARDPESRLRVVIALRSDFFDHLTRHPGLASAFEEAHLLVGPMSRAELREAVTRPARARNLNVARGLTDLIVNEVERDASALPLMSHALDQAWRFLSGHLLDEAAYEKAGGLHRAIERTAENVYKDLTPAQRDHARRVLLQLVTPGESEHAPSTRRTVRKSELTGTLGPDGVREVDEVVDRLVAARLLTLGQEDVDLAHEALISAWPRLGGWIADERDKLRVHRRLTDGAEEWLALGQDPEALYRGARLDAVREHFPPAERALRLTAGENAFVEASERRGARHIRLRRGITAALAVLTLLAIAATVVASEQRATARTERNAAVFQQMVAKADLVRDSNRPLAARLDVAARALGPDSDVALRLSSDAGAVLGNPIAAHRGLVTGTDFAPDGDVLATAAHDGTLRLWNTADPRRPRPLGAPLTGFPARPESLAFSPRGHLLALGLHNGQVMLYDTARSDHPRLLGTPLTAHDSAVAALRVSPDGTTLATGGVDGAIRLWDLADPARPVAHGDPITAHRGGVQALDFAQDGDTLASGGYDNAVRLWNITRPDRPRPAGHAPTAHTRPVFSVAFSPDGRSLASGSYDQTVRMWDVTDPADPRPRHTPVLRAHHAAVLSVAFSSDGTTLLSAGEDNSLQLWNVLNPDYAQALGDPVTGHTSGVWTARFRPGDPLTLASSGYDGALVLWHRPRTVLTDFTNPLLSVDISPDGALLAVGSEADAAVRLYDIRDPVHPRKVPGGPLPHKGPVNAVVFTPDGRTLITGSADHTVRLWKVSPAAGGPLRAAPLDAGGPIRALALSRDGRTLAVAADGETVRLWRLRPGAVSGGAGTLRLPGRVDSLAWHPDGRTLAAAVDDGTISLLDTRTRRTLGRLTGHQGEVSSLAFSPDGRTLASGGADRTVRLWDTTRPAEARSAAVLTGHGRRVHTVAFSPDGRTLASGSEDRSVRLWNLRDSARAAAAGLPLAGHTDSVVALAFAPGGHTLASVGYDLTARLWPLDPDTAEREVCAYAGAALPRRTWQEQLPQVPYRPGCDGAGAGEGH
ncbi:WD40 repeat domain-containing protein [Streptomyces sp. NPDC088258]|uniref:nSTAND1 domain-containing NTPase n=1 Tax=Streptomyces sp. NPDC088258 TaxID=3365849 RepID=UPI0038182CBE